MIKKCVLLIVSFVFFSIIVSAQTGSVKGKVIDADTGEPIPFANVVAERDGQMIGGASTDFDGNYIIKDLDPGKLDLEATFVGYITQKVEGVIVSADQVTFQELKLKQSAVSLEEVNCVDYKVPLISKDQTASGSVITSEEIRKMPSNSASRASTVGGVYTSNKGNIRSARTYDEVVYVDGVKISKKEAFFNDRDYNTESYDPIVENEFLDVLNNPLSTFSIDVDRASYSNTRRFLNSGHMPPPGAVRIEELINYFSYDYPEPGGEHPFSVNLEMTPCPWNSENQLLLVGLQGKTIRKKDVKQSNLVFLIDVSGSMDWENKLPMVKESMKILVNNLGKDDIVSIAVYAGAAGMVLEPTSGRHKEKILDAIDRLQAGGSTAGGAGIKLAYKLANENFLPEGNNRVILATDGDFNVGVSNNSELVKLIEEKREDGVFLSVLGFGMGNYKDAKMEKLSNAGNGNYAYIDNLAEAKKVFGKEFFGTLFTIAKDVKIQIEFNPQHISSYRLIGYENRLLRDEDFNDDTKDAGEIGAGHSVTALYEISTKDAKEENPAVDPLKYQELVLRESPEYLSIKLRYKEPDGKKSKLIEEVFTEDELMSMDAGRNLKFAACVAEFGMLIRDSRFKGDASYRDLLKRIKASIEKEDDECRKEFYSLVRKAKSLD